MEHAMMDMGHKEESPTVVGENKGETRVHYPSFSMEGDQIPEELKNATLEDMCRCEIIIKKVGDSIATYTKGQPRRVEVEIHKLGYIAHAGKKTFEEYDKSSKEEKENYDKESTEIKEHQEE